MKTLRKILYALIVSLCAFAVSCTEDDTFTPGEPDLEGCYGVYFPEQDNTGAMEIDPADDLTFTYKVNRNNAEGAITVPVVISTNTDDMYTVSPIEFADGEDETTFTVTLSTETQLGKVYSVIIDITDPQYVSQYTIGFASSIAMSINRVRWLDLGYVDYTDDLINGWYGLGVGTYKVKLQARADSIEDEDKFYAALEGDTSAGDKALGALYRLVSPYNNTVWTSIGGLTFDSASSYDILLYATEYDKVYIPLQDTGIVINDGEGIGMVTIYSEVAYYLDNNREPDESRYGSIKNGKLTFPVQAVYGCPGGSYAGNNTYYANQSGEFCVNIAPALNKYELVLPDPEKGTDGDFSFADVTLPDGTLFYSESLLQAWEQNLQVGTPTVSTDDADKVFEEAYGKLYRLPNLYANGYDIYFCIKDGDILTPDDFYAQEMGISQLSQSLVAVINSSKSYFDENTNEVSLVIEIMNDSGKLSFGRFSEVLSATVPDFEVAASLDLARDFNYTTLFNDTFKSGIVGDSWKTDIQIGKAVDAQKGARFEAAYGKAYCLPSLYAPNYNIYFCAKEDGSAFVPADYEVQPTGLEMLGQKIYATVVSGTVNDFGATLKIQFADESGDLILGSYTESIVTYTWSEVATGTYTSMMFNNPFSGITMSQAEGTELYRLDDFLGTGKHLEFYWHSATNKCELNGIIGSGVDYDGNGNEMKLVDAKSYFNDLNGNNYSWELLEANGYHQSTYDPSTLTFSLYVKWVIPSLDLGTQFGTETFVLDGAPNAATWENVAVGTFTHTMDFWLDKTYLPYQETDLILQRFGTTNKYKIVGVAEGQMDLIFTHDPATGAIKVPEVYIGQSVEDDSIYCGDIWAAYSAWISAGLVDSSKINETLVYTAYPNSYDEATKTYSFSLMYYDHAGYGYTEIGIDDADAHTFQITGDAPAAGTASVKSVAGKKFVANVNNHRALAKGISKAGVRKTNTMNVRKFSAITDKPVLCRKSSGKGLAAAKPVKRELKCDAEAAAL